MSFKYEVSNQKQFSANIRKAIKEVGDLTVPFNLIAHDWFRSNKSIFQLRGPGQFEPFKNSEVAQTFTGRPIGRVRTGFFTIKESPYQRFKLKKYGFDYPLLKATGKLAESVTEFGSPNSVYKNTGHELVIGSKVSYGLFHNSDKPRSTMPLRKFIFIGPEAPRFATSEQMGRPQRWFSTINVYVLKRLGKTTGAAVKITNDKVLAGDIRI
jgi:phage gpG-like protein